MLRFPQPQNERSPKIDYPSSPCHNPIALKGIQGRCLLKLGHFSALGFSGATIRFCASMGCLECRAVQPDVAHRSASCAASLEGNVMTSP